MPFVGNICIFVLPENLEIMKHIEDNEAYKGLSVAKGIAQPQPMKQDNLQTTLDPVLARQFQTW